MSRGAPSTPSAPAPPSALTIRRRSPCRLLSFIPLSSMIFKPAISNGVILHEPARASAKRRRSPWRAQLETLNLAGGGLGQLGKKLDPARKFVVREMPLDVLLDCGAQRGIGNLPGPQDDESLRLDQLLVILLSDDGRLEHRGMRDDGGLDLGWRNPDTADLEHIVVAA